MLKSRISSSFSQQTELENWVNTHPYYRIGIGVAIVGTLPILSGMSAGLLGWGGIYGVAGQSLAIAYIAGIGLLLASTALYSFNLGRSNMATRVAVAGMAVGAAPVLGPPLVFTGVQVLLHGGGGPTADKEDNTASIAFVTVTALLAAAIPIIGLINTYAFAPEASLTGMFLSATGLYNPQIATITLGQAAAIMDTVLIVTALVASAVLIFAPDIKKLVSGKSVTFTELSRDNSQGQLPSV